MPRDNYVDTPHTRFVLEPQRTMSVRGQCGVVFAVAAFPAFGGFLLTHTTNVGNAGPVIAGFMAFPVMATALGFWLHNVRQRRWEEIRIGDQDVSVLRHYAWRKSVVEPPMDRFGLQVETQTFNYDDDFGNFGPRCEKLGFRLRDRFLEIGSFLRPPEKMEVAEALRQAIAPKFVKA